MRISIFYCLLLASFAVASPNGRNQRHLSHLKNLIKSAGRRKINIQPQTDVKEENGYKVFRLPGYNDIVIKISPKKPVHKEFVYPAAVDEVNLNAFESDVGPKTKDNVAVKEVNNLLSTGILYGNPRVKLLETLKTETEVPMCIKKRVNEAIVLGADPSRFAPVQEVYQYQSQPVEDFSYPRIEANSFVQSADSSRFAPVQELYQHQTAPFIDFSYPSADTNSYVQNSLSEQVADYGVSPHWVRPLKDSPVRYNSGPRKTQVVNPRPVSLHSHKSLHFEPDISDSKEKVNSQTRKVKIFNYLGEKVDIDQTLGPIPPQYIKHVDNKTGKIAESNKNIMKTVPIVGLKDNIANANIPVDVYKSQRNPNTGEVVNETMPLRTNVETSFNKYMDTQTLVAEEDNAQEGNVFTNKVTTKPSSVTLPIVLASTNAAEQPLREVTQTSFKITPPPKGNKNYSYQQKHADGSSMNVEDDKDGVAVSDKKNNNGGRGDIPD